MWGMEHLENTAGGGQREGIVPDLGVDCSRHSVPSPEQNSLQRPAIPQPSAQILSSSFACCSTSQQGKGPHTCSWAT